MTPQDALASMPKKIKVGPHTYIVRIVENLQGDMAEIDTDAQSIEIVSSAASAPQVVGRLVHELLHAIWQDRDLGKRADEERVVLQYESGLIQLFQDNPKLLTWIRRGLK